MADKTDVTSAHVADALVSAVDETMKVMMHRLRPVLKNEGITWEQFLTLHLVSRLHPASSVAIAKHLSVSQPTVCVSIDHLETAGLIARRRSERNRRMVELCVTARGRRVEARIWEQMRSLILEAAGNTPLDELSAAARVLHELSQRLEAGTEEPR
jgi:DNA-binding MarR family transcriptional regulator